MKLQCDQSDSGHIALVFSHWSRYHADENLLKKTEYEDKLKAVTAAFQEKRQKALL